MLYSLLPQCRATGCAGVVCATLCTGSRVFLHTAAAAAFPFATAAAYSKREGAPPDREKPSMPGDTIRGTNEQMAAA